MTSVRMNLLQACGAAVALTISMPALAQTAIGDGRRLGDGRVLDRGFNSRGGRQNDARVSFGDELRFRNSVVTGNAPGGIAFRGDVGYRAPGDLSISVGSDTTFAFRRDSFYSGLGGQGIRGTDALQYQFSATSGSRPPTSFNRFDLSRNDVSSLSPAGNAVRNSNADNVTKQSWNAANAERTGDTRGEALSLLRSPSAYNTARTLQPALMGVTRDESGERFGMVASPMRGLQRESLDKKEKDKQGPQAVQRANLTDLPGAAKPEAQEDVGATRRDRRSSGLGVPPLEGDEKGDGSPVFESAFDLAMKRMQSGEKQGPTVIQKMAELREKLERDTSELRAKEEREAAARREAEREAAERGRAGEGKEGEDKGEDEPQPGDERRPAPGAGRDLALPSDGVNALRDLKVDISTFAPKGFDAYSEHMAAGQRLLEQGRYFDAEERFTAALSTKPGDTTAALARVNAALGASLFRSAGLNLRTLLLDQPEVAAVRFGTQTLPPPARLARVKEGLRTTLSDPKTSSRDIGLLLAYAGLHSKDAAAIKDGLDVLGAATDAADDPGANRAIRLAELLREVWVLEPKDGAAPVEPPTPGPTKPEGGR